MSGHKLVDSAFLAQLISGSFETVWGAVSEAMDDPENAEMFGGPESQIIATFEDRVIVAAPDGTFYQAEWSFNDDGTVEFSGVEDLEVPVYESSELGPHVRSESMLAVEAILSGREDEADAHVDTLAGMVAGGAKLTAEGVEDAVFRQTTANSRSSWFEAVVERADSIKEFVGAEMDRLPKAGVVFESVDPARSEVKDALGSLVSKLSSLWERITLAAEIDDDYVSPGDDQMGVVEFVDFVDGFATDFDRTIGLVEEAMAVVEDGDLGALGRTHDAVAAQYPQFAMTAAFVEKMARRFAPPQAA